MRTHITGGACKRKATPHAHAHTAVRAGAPLLLARGLIMFYQLGARFTWYGRAAIARWRLSSSLLHFGAAVFSQERYKLFSGFVAMQDAAYSPTGAFKHCSIETRTAACPFLRTVHCFWLCTKKKGIVGDVRLRFHFLFRGLTVRHRYSRVY